MWYFNTSSGIQFDISYDNFKNYIKKKMFVLVRDGLKIWPNNEQ